MKKNSQLVIFVLVTLLISAIPLAKAADALAPPTVTMPNNNWEKTDEKPYPQTQAEHDPSGAGLLEYTDQSNYDVVRIYYEKAQVTSYTSTQLKNEAEDLFENYDASDTRQLDDSGTATFAGVETGFAEGLDEVEGTFKTELVFIKGGYYINVYAYYDNTDESKDNVTSLINSVSVSGESGLPTDFPWLYLIIGIIAVVAIIIIIMMLRRKKTAQPEQPTQIDYPPPPPPPT